MLQTQDLKIYQLVLDGEKKTSAVTYTRYELEFD